MLIACLGWGSLVWDPRGLPVQRKWFSDGPLLPIEFAGRSSKDNRVTLVLLAKASVVRSMWALMTLTDLDAAREALANREGSTSKDKPKNIGYWCAERQSKGLGVATISEWARRAGVEGVIWTDLPPKFGIEFRDDLVGIVISHLQQLPAEQQQLAESYIRRTPRQVDTPVRREIERKFGWSPRS
jgi:hypothetical protein